MLHFSHLSHLSVHLGARSVTLPRPPTASALGEFMGQRMLANRTNDGSYAHSLFTVLPQHHIARTRSPDTINSVR
jgi:hypothetical protein